MSGNVGQGNIFGMQQAVAGMECGHGVYLLLARLRILFLGNVQITFEATGTQIAQQHTGNQYTYPESMHDGIR